MVTKTAEPAPAPSASNPSKTQQLLSLIDAKPTLHVLNGPGVRVLRSGAVYIVNPTQIRVTGTAQPGTPRRPCPSASTPRTAPGTSSTAASRSPSSRPTSSAAITPRVALPSTIRKDVNFLVAREEAVGTQVSQIAINGTTIRNLSGTSSSIPARSPA